MGRRAQGGGGTPQTGAPGTLLQWASSGGTGTAWPFNTNPGTDSALALLLPVQALPGDVLLALARLTVSREAGSHPGVTVRCIIWADDGGDPGDQLAQSAAIDYDALPLAPTPPDVPDSTIWPFNGPRLTGGVNVHIGLYVAGGAGALTVQAGGSAANSPAYATAGTPAGPWLGANATQRGQVESEYWG